MSPGTVKHLPCRLAVRIRLPGRGAAEKKSGILRIGRENTDKPPAYFVLPSCNTLLQLSYLRPSAFPAYRGGEAGLDFLNRDETTVVRRHLPLCDRDRPNYHLVMASGRKYSIPEKKVYLDEMKMTPYWEPPVSVTKTREGRANVLEISEQDYIVLLIAVGIVGLVHFLPLWHYEQGMYHADTTLCDANSAVGLPSEQANDVLSDNTTSYIDAPLTKFHLTQPIHGLAAERTGSLPDDVENRLHEALDVASCGMGVDLKQGFQKCPVHHEEYSRWLLKTPGAGNQMAATASGRRRRRRRTRTLPGSWSSSCTSVLTPATRTATNTNTTCAMVAVYNWSGRSRGEPHYLLPPNRLRYLLDYSASIRRVWSSDAAGRTSCCRLGVPLSWRSAVFIDLVSSRVGRKLLPLQTVHEAYCNILDNEVLPTLWRFYGMNPCYFHDPSARCHVSRATMQWYADSNVRRLDWPAHSPDFNPIEQLWNELDRRVRVRQARPKSIAQLIEWLQEEWRRIPVGVLQTLVESMSDGVAAVIASRGTTVAEWLARSPPTKAILVQSPAGSLRIFAMWESSRTIPLVKVPASIPGPDGREYSRWCALVCGVWRKLPWCRRFSRGSHVSSCVVILPHLHPHLVSPHQFFGRTGAIADNRIEKISRNALDSDTLLRNLLHPDWLPLIASHRIAILWNQRKAVGSDQHRQPPVIHIGAGIKGCCHKVTSHQTSPVHHDASVSMMERLCGAPSDHTVTSVFSVVKANPHRLTKIAHICLMSENSLLEAIAIKSEGFMLQLLH
ncbi:hypothetical protein PR048_003084 [Dryococelus australis]|uniref:Tc1-like transposase DDE domain-containing protein n=1 Tax=Dryococelus australis TaxID=614101 RepID=A0ABQ9IM69_9NEOP|nr:hypothetical protein PR048_003084 [Dryococelus australis]